MLTVNIWSGNNNLLMPQLPPEVWERIIDTVWTLFHKDTFYLEFMLACALTCRVWAHRALFYLRHRLAFTTTRIGGKLVHRFTSRSPVIDLSLITHLEVESIEQSLFLNTSIYTPFATHATVKRLKNLQVVTLREINWRSYPANYHSIISNSLSRITTLQLFTVRFASVVDFMFVTYALPNLQSLRCDALQLEEPMTDDHYERISRGRRAGSFSQLTDLCFNEVSVY